MTWNMEIGLMRNFLITDVFKFPSKMLIFGPKHTREFARSLGIHVLRIPELKESARKLWKSFDA